MKPIQLKYIHDVRLPVSVPFNFWGTMHKPSHFPAPVDHFERDTLWLTMRVENQVYGIRMKPSDGGRSVSLRIFSKKKTTQREIDLASTELRFRFAMDLDLEEFIRLAKKDPLLKPVEKKWRGMRPSCAFSLYELLCITITLQNAQVSRSVKMLTALLQAYGTAVEFDNQTLFSFWTAEKLSTIPEEDLRSLKIGYRAKSFGRVASFFSANPSFEKNIRRLSTPEAAAQLREIYGVGPATSWYLLFEALKRPEAFDHVSPWEQKILSRLMFDKELVSETRILRESRKRWGDWRMLAVHYIFEDLFWRRKTERIKWLEELIRL